jgi:ribosomal protein S18 acetylase RimI-like enzyme
MNEIVYDVSIRDFRKSDLQNVLDLAELCFVKELELTGWDPEHVKKMVDQMFGIAGRIFLTLSKLFRMQPIKFFVADVNSRVVGTTIVTKRRKVGYISTVMVHPDYRRKGIARKLMKFAVDYIRKNKMKRAVLHVASTNETAKSLYTKLDFREFEKIVYLIGNVDPSIKPVEIEGTQVRGFQKNDTNAVYDLIKSSEDPKHLEIFEFKRNDLKASFVQRVFRFSTENKIVAVHNNSIVGYAQVLYTTAKEAGQIATVQVYPEMRSRGIEEMLIHSGIEEIKKIGTKKVLGIVSLKRPELIAATMRFGFEKSLELNGMVLEFA